MYLKEAQLENFKTFKKKTIPFLNGFTAITGPNGSGKSNISDAILFVLGPKSSKVIRAGRLTELIFDGGASKKAADFCEVSLVFDDVGDILPENGGTLKLTRRVKYSPSNPENYYSYFYVNSKSSSLTEFENLLARARIFGDRYNIVQQGDVNSVVKMSNLERRRLLDDIAGITNFDRDIERAEHKSAGVASNLERIDIVLSEIKRSLSILSKDRQNALRYRELKDKLMLRKYQHAEKRKQELDNQLGMHGEHIAKYERSRSERENEHSERNKELGRAQHELRKLEAKLVELGGDEVKALREKIGDVELELVKAREGVNHSKDEIRRFKTEKNELHVNLSKLEKERKNHDKRKRAAAVEIKRTNTELKGKEKEYREVQKRIAQSSTECLKYKNKLAKLKKNYEHNLVDLKNARIEADVLTEQLKRLELEVRTLEETINTYELYVKDQNLELKKLEKECNEHEARIKELHTRFFEMRDTEAKQSQQENELAPIIRRLRQEYSQMKAEADANDAFQKGYSRGVNAILDARDRGLLKNVHGAIAELGKVPERYELALSIAAGSRLQSIVVGNDEDAANAINHLKRSKTGRAAFLPLNKMSARPPRGKALMAVRDKDAIGFAIDLIEFDERYKNAFAFVFGDTLVVNTLSAARRLMGGVRLVTLDGELIEPSGAMIGGTVRQTIRFGAGAQELDKLGKKLKAAIEHQEHIALQLAETKRQLGELSSELSALKNEKDSKTLRVRELETQRHDYLAKLESFRAEYERQTRELEAARDKLDAQTEKVNSLTTSIDALEAEKNKYNKLLLSSTSNVLATRAKELEASRAELRDKMRDLDSEAKTVETQIGMQDERMQELHARVKQIGNAVLEHKERIAKLKESQAKYEDELKALTQVEQKMSTELQALRARRDETYDRTKDLQNALETLSAQIETYTNMIADARRRIPQLENQIAELIAEMRLYDVEPEHTTHSIDELRAEINACQHGLNRLEPVNMKAIEEYDEQEQRKAKLEGEVKRLADERKNLLALVEELKTKKKDGLLNVFETVKDNFKRIYSELSDEGEAELILENPNEPFEGGLAIRVKKDERMVGLHTLSGGQKSLTALALIFAIQRFDPSPFYVLDEVDMYLDAINAEQVAKMVKRNSEMAQFVIISLREVTLKEADHVYGVVRRDGISKLVGSVNMGGGRT